jgi:hypothetical protein
MRELQIVLRGHPLSHAESLHHLSLGRPGNDVNRLIWLCLSELGLEIVLFDEVIFGYERLRQINSFGFKNLKNSSFRISELIMENV